MSLKSPVFKNKVLYEISITKYKIVNSPKFVLTDKANLGNSRFIKTYGGYRMNRIMLAVVLVVGISGSAFAAEKTPTREKLDTIAQQVIVTDLDIANSLESKEFLLKNFDKEGMAEILMQLKDLIKINAEMVDRLRRVL